MGGPIIGLDRLPERFMNGPKTKLLAEYITRKYGQYGYRRGKGIMRVKSIADRRYTIIGYR